MCDDKKQLLCSNNFSLETKKKLIKSYIWSVALYGLETWTLRKSEERFVNAVETRCWRRMLKVTWTGRIMNDEVFSKDERRKITFKNFKKLTPLMDRAYN